MAEQKKNPTEAWERELDGAVHADRDLDLTGPLPEYEGELVIDGVSANELAKR